MDRINKFWETLNLPPDVLENLLKEDGPDPAELATGVLETQKKLLTTGLMSKEEVDQTFNTHRIKLAADVNKALKLGMSRSEIEKFKWDDYLKLVSEKVDEALKAAQKATDETLRDELYSTKSDKAKLAADLEALQNSVEEKIAERTRQIEAERNAEAIENNFNKVFSKLTFVPGREEIDQHYLKSTVLAHYEVSRTGGLTQNGGKEAVNFAGNGHFKNLEEAVKWLYESKKMHPQHKGGGGGGIGSPLGTLTEKTHRNTIELQKRMEKAKNR